MTRIGSSAPGNVFLPPPEPKVPEELSLHRLPEELPPASHTPPSLLDLSKLILAEEIDLSLLQKVAPLNETVNRLWLEVTLRAIVSGGGHTKISMPLSSPKLKKRRL